MGSDPTKTVFFNGFLESFSSDFFKGLFGKATVDLGGDARCISELIDRTKHLLLVGPRHEEFFNTTHFT